MKTWKQMLLLVGTCCCALAAFAAQATPITYNFTVTASGGPLDGISSSGTFTYDSSSVPATLPGAVDQIALLTDLAFTWDGISYDETTANTGRLSFDAAGVLEGGYFGNSCGAGTCAVISETTDWYVLWSGLTGSFAYSGVEAVYPEGIASLSAAGVPEPATLGLLGLGLAGLGFSRRRKKA